MAKILIIDDEPETIKLLESIVKMDGHETLAVLESRKAIQAVETFLPDIVLLYIMMPEINGIAVCKLIKANANTNHIKVMIVSALSDDGTRRDASNAGADLFVTKPIMPRTLTQHIKDLYGS